MLVLLLKDREIIQVAAGHNTTRRNESKKLINMPRPDGGLITETNRQYYAGAQQQYSATGGVGQTFTSTFDTNLIFGSSDPTNGQYGLNNFLLYKSPDALTWTELTPATTVQNAVATENGGVASATIQIAAANANIIAGMSIYGGGITNNPTGAKVCKCKWCCNNFRQTYCFTRSNTVATTAVLFQFDRTIFYG